MKRVYTILAAFLLTTILWAQSPEKMSYQAVIRNSSGQLVMNRTIGMQISILQGSASGLPVYVETQAPYANENGLVSMEIGNGTVVSGDFTSIDWADGPYFIQTETDPTGGSAYSITGTCQLLSVPYALYAKTAETIAGTITETDPVFTASQAANITNTDIINLDNLSGVNTGDQDLSGLATETALGDSVALLRTQIPDISGLATETALGDSVAELRTEIPDVSGFITTETQNLADVIALNNSANGQIKNLVDPTDAQDAATKAYVDALQTEITELQILLGLKMKDYQGNVYEVVTIGTQVWMAENLKVTKFNNGDDIPFVTDPTSWSNLTSPGYCWYVNTSETNEYGALYNWYTVNSGNLCPTGWHVPSDVEWTTLTNYLGGTSVAGGKLKETGTEHWMSPNTGATNETGFTALPGGCRDSNGVYTYMSTGGFYWSTTPVGVSTRAWYRYLNYNEATISRLNNNKNTGYSVRCIKD
jgi:uncharacterized protein (TIGR02145 family)